MKGTDVAEELKFGGKSKFAGIGLAKRTTEVRVLRGGEKPRRFSGTSTGEAGREKLAGMPGPEDTAGTEACAFAFSPARYLERQTGCAAHVLNPGKRAMIWKPARKTDREDARKTARFIQRYPEGELPPAEEEESRSLVPLKGFPAKLRTQAANRLRARYARTGITGLKKSGLAKKEGREKRAGRLPEPLRCFALMPECGIRLYGERTGRKAGSHGPAPCVLPVPGTGIASAFPAYAGDGSRFGKPPEAANCAGPAPRADCSGDTDRYGRITKAGRRPLGTAVLRASRAVLRP